MSSLVSVTFPDCGHTVAHMRSKRIPEQCPACATGIPEGATQCEDFPCCGHTDGDGCIPRPEHTSDYWLEMMQGMDGAELDDFMERMGDDY